MGSSISDSSRASSESSNASSDSISNLCKEIRGYMIYKNNSRLLANDLGWLKPYNDSRVLRQLKLTKPTPAHGKYHGLLTGINLMGHTSAFLSCAAAVVPTKYLPRRISYTGAVFGMIASAGLITAMVASYFDSKLYYHAIYADFG